MSSRPEDEWVRMAGVGDEEAVRHLVRRYLGMVWGVAVYHLGDPGAASGVTGEVIREALAEVGRIPDPMTFRRSLHARAVTAARGARRSTAAGPSPGGEVALDAVRALPPDLQEPAILRYFDGLSYAALGARTGLDPSGVDRLLRRAKGRPASAGGG